MTAINDSAVQVTSLGPVTTIALGARPQSPMRYIGCVPIALGIGDLVFCVVWVLVSLVGMRHPALQVEGAPPPDPVAFQYLFLLFAVPFVLGGVMSVLFGMRLFLKNTTTIEIREEELLVTTKAGPLSKKRRRPLGEISQLRIADSYPGLQFGSNAMEPPRSSFLVDCKVQPMLVVGAGYFKETVIRAANALADELKRRGLAVERPQTEISVEAGAADAAMQTGSADRNAADAEGATKGEVVAAKVEAPVEAAVQPGDSKVTFLAEPESLTFVVPRTGVKGAAVAFLVFALFWNLISWTITIVFLGVFLGNPSIENAFPLLFLTLFIAVGFGICLLFLQTAFRRAVIVATREALIVTQKAPVKDREFQWIPSDITAILADYSGTSVNNRRFKELRINLTGNRHQGFFDGRDDAELEWMAATLRGFYGR